MPDDYTAALLTLVPRVIKRATGESDWRRTMECWVSPSPHWRTVRSQRSRTHTESGRQRWWDIAQRVSARRAAPFVRSSRCGIRAQPMASRFAQLVDALNRESRQILHRFLRNCVALEPLHRVSITNSCLTELSCKIFLNVGIVPLRPSGVNKNRPPDIVVALQLWKTSLGLGSVV
jgi:hypothetical protein